MKLILSRKGFDSTWDKYWFGSGGCPSPIFPDETMLSLPIPGGELGTVVYDDLSVGGKNFGKLVTDLTEGKVPSVNFAHLDPDINREAYQRQEGWRPLFGQAGIAAGHLRKEGVQEGDLFLFFGLFQRVEDMGGRWRFISDAPWQHVLWGWLQIQDIHKVDDLGPDDLPWARYHDHLHPEMRGARNNTVYIASDHLDLGDGRQASGAGAFPQFDERLLLTNPDGASVTQWRLPSWFYPSAGKKMLSWHGNNRGRWTPEPDAKYAYLNSQSRGQEFVLDCDHYPEAIGWASDFIRDFGER